jgi:lysyl-tRNA synthetase class 1
MQWIDDVVSAAQTLRQEGEVIVSSGASPSGTYHFGHLRELVTCDAIVMALQRAGRQAKHIHVVDDLDALRKIPVNIPAEYEQFLGMPLCDVPAPDGSERSYAAFFVEPFIDAVRAIGVDVEVIYASERYRSGFYVPAIERALDRIAEAKRSLEEISGRQLDEHWTPVQIMKDGRLKNRSYVGIDTEKKVVFYSDEAGIQQEARYDTGEVKIDWRLDWPGRWWLMQVAVEPFGRDHATKGGSYDTGVAISRSVYGNEPPVPVPYDFINRTGDTKKMSASKGTGVHAHEVTQTLPAEVIRYFMLRYAPSKRLFFDEHATLMKLVDDFSALLSKENKTEQEQELVYLCTARVPETIISKVPFTLLVDTYQAALRDTERALEIIGRTEYKEIAKAQKEIIIKELAFIGRWLEMWAPDEVKFQLAESVDASTFSEEERAFFTALAEDIRHAPEDASGEWFHQAIYGYKERAGLAPKQLFSALYRLIIGKTSGPRAGWFLSILPREWLYGRLLFRG